MERKKTEERKKIEGRRREERKDGIKEGGRERERED